MVNIVVILWIYYQDIFLYVICVYYTYLVHPAHLVHPPLLDHLLTEYEIYNMSIICIIQNCMNKLAGDLIKMFKNNSKVGIGGGKVLTGPWIINIYPNVFNVCLTWISRNYCKSNISNQVWSHERSLFSNQVWPPNALLFV